MWDNDGMVPRSGERGFDVSMSCGDAVTGCRVRGHAWVSKRAKKIRGAEGLPTMSGDPSSRGML